MALDPGILPGPARVEAKKRGFLPYARHLRRRGTSLCLEVKKESAVFDACAWGGHFGAVPDITVRTQCL